MRQTSTSSVVLRMLSVFHFEVTVIPPPCVHRTFFTSRFPVTLNFVSLKGLERLKFKLPFQFPGWLLLLMSTGPQSWIYPDGATIIVIDQKETMLCCIVTSIFLHLDIQLDQPKVETLPEHVPG